MAETSAEPSWTKESGAFHQQVRMAAVQVSGLRPEELAPALAFEVEPFSGVPANEAEVFSRPVVDPDPTVRVFEVYVRRRGRRGGASGGAGRWLKALVALGVLAFAAMAWDGVELARRKAALSRTVAERRPLQAQLDKLKADAQSARAEAESVKSAREAAIRAQDEAAALRAAYADALAEIAPACGARAVVTALSADEAPWTLRAEAIAVSAEAAAAVMRELAARAAAKGWRLAPGAITASGTGATATFGFTLAKKEG